MNIDQELSLLVQDPDTPAGVILDWLLEKEVAVASVFIVFGEKGEHSDYTVWDVAAFLDESKAKELTRQLNGWCKERGFHKGYGDVKPEEEVCLLDEQFMPSYGGVSYHYHQLQLRG